MNNHEYDHYLLDDYASSAYKYLQKSRYTPPEPKQVTSRFKVGDRVRLKNGTAEIEVTGIYALSGYLDGRYVNSDHLITSRHQDDFVPYDGESKMTNTNKLYVFKDSVTTSDLYGHYLATNSQGEWVMEVKGSGQIVAVAKAQVQEVLPYTIGVQFGDSATTYHYLADKDKFGVGFYLVKSQLNHNWQIAKVTAVDTKSNKATKEFSDIVLGKLAVDLY